MVNSVMGYFVVVEFNGFGGDLIFLAAIPEEEDGTPFYEAVVCAEPKAWVRANVLPLLQTNPRRRDEAARLFADYLQAEPDPVILCDRPEDIAYSARPLTNDRGIRMLAGER